MKRLIFIVGLLLLVGVIAGCSAKNMKESEPDIADDVNSMAEDEGVASTSAPADSVDTADKMTGELNEPMAEEISEDMGNKPEEIAISQQDLDALKTDIQGIESEDLGGLE